MENLVIKTINPKGRSPNFAVERAHRVHRAPQKPGARPSPFIAKILNYRDRDVILRTVRENGPIQIENQAVQIYPDYTQEVQAKRRTFDKVKFELRQKELQYMMIFPAKLKVLA